MTTKSNIVGYMYVRKEMYVCLIVTIIDLWVGIVKTRSKRSSIVNMVRELPL